MRSRLVLALVASLVLPACESPSPAASPATSPGLPALEAPYRVLILGDSISIGYTATVRELLQGEAEVRRPMRTRAEGKPPRPENCEGTNKGVGAIERWTSMEGGPFDVIHFNFGLHDMKRVDAGTGRNSNDPLDPHQASPERYGRQLRQIVDALQATGARLVFATTTPVPEGDLRPYREPADAVEYNRVALAIMEEERIPVDDLFAFIRSSPPELQKPADVHFTREGSRALAAQVVRSIRAAAAGEAFDPSALEAARGALAAAEAAASRRTEALGSDR